MEDRFDFLFVMAGRTGSMAMQNFLSLHPDIAAVPRTSLDEASNNRNGLTLPILHADYLPIIRHCHSVGKKTALVLRAFQPLWKDEQAIKHLAQIVHPDGLVMVVRHPEAYLRSWYHGYIFSKCGYQFSSNGLPWFGGTTEQPAIEVPLRMPTPEITCPVFPSERLAELAAPETAVFVSPVLKYIRCFEFYNRLSEHFTGRKQVLDFSVLNGPAGMKRVFRAMSVDDTFTSPVFSISQNGRANRYMYGNNIIARLFEGPSMVARLWTSNDFKYNMDQSGPGPGVEFSEVASVPIPDQQRLGLPISMPSDRIALGVHRWRDYPLAKWRFLTESGELERATQFLLSQWIANVREIENALAPHVLTELPSVFKAEVERAFNADSRHLMALYPDEIGHWTPTG